MNMRWGLLFVIATVLGCNTDKSIHVKGNIEGLDIDKVVLCNQILKPIDTVMVERGQFDFKLPLTVNYSDYFLLVGDKSRIKFQLVDNYGVEVNCDYTGNGNKTDIKGSEYYNEYLHMNKEFKLSEQTLFKAYRNRFAAYEKNDFKLAQEYTDVASIVKKEMAGHLLPFVKKYGDRKMTPFLIGARYGSLLPEDKIALYELLKGEALKAKESSGLKRAFNSAQTCPVGKPAPNFEVFDRNGEVFTLDELKGKYVLIDFWGSGCSACRRAIPTVKKIRDEFKNEPLVIVGLSLDTKKEPWIKAFEHDGADWLQGCDFKGGKSDLLPKYGIEGIPHKTIIDPDGNIVVNATSAMLAHVKLRSILKQ